MGGICCPSTATNLHDIETETVLAPGERGNILTREARVLEGPEDPGGAWQQFVAYLPDWRTRCCGFRNRGSGINDSAPSSAFDTHPIRKVSNGWPEPGLSGDWTMARHQGNFDAFLTEVGAPWVARQAAGAANYGVGKRIEVMKLNGENLTMEMRTPFTGTTSREIRVNGCEQDSYDIMGKRAIKILPYWEKKDGRKTLAVESWVLPARAGDPAEELPFQRRWLEGSEMVMENISAKGTSIKIFFSKTSG